MLNFGDIFGKIQSFQEEMKKTQSRLEGIVIEGQAGGGMVTVQVNGLRKVLKTDIDQALIDGKDKEMIGDLVAAAINQAMEKADLIYKEEMAKTAQSSLPQIPGLDPGKLGF
jgi:DNA-binding YbaB/EbfC family protein